MGTLRPLYSLPPLLSSLSDSQVAAITAFLLLDSVCSCCPGLWRHWASFSVYFSHSAVVTCLVPDFRARSDIFLLSWLVCFRARLCMSSLFCVPSSPVWWAHPSLASSVSDCIHYTHMCELHLFCFHPWLLPWNLLGHWAACAMPASDCLTCTPRSRIPEASFHCILSGFAPLIPL